MKPINKKLKTFLLFVIAIILFSAGTYYFKGINPLRAIKEYFIPELGEVELSKDKLPLKKIFINIENRQKISLSEMTGRVTLVHFWATWCAPCLVELPNLEKFVEQFRDRDMNFLFISHENRSKLQSFKQSGKTSLPIHYASPQGLGSFSGLQIPRTYLLSKSGKIVYAYVGAQDWTSQKITQLIEKHLSL